MTACNHLFLLFHCTNIPKSVPICKTHQLKYHNTIITTTPVGTARQPPKAEGMHCDGIFVASDRPSQTTSSLQFCARLRQPSPSLSRRDRLSLKTHEFVEVARIQSCRQMGATHQRVSMYVWRTHTPLPFIHKLCISALDTAAVPTATGALKQTRGTVCRTSLSVGGLP